ncbi:MAG: COX15/CtaA family protein [Planctomycetota bacterium]|nr:COX15/CtaA family protein [Planctomycetota bacterium]
MSEPSNVRRASADPAASARGRGGWNVPFLVACLLVAATAVLLSFGALVTTYEAAMAVPDWPATYGHNMFLFPLAEWLGGPWDLFLEHGHRLLGALVGMIALVLAAVAWRYPVGPTVRWLTLAAVALVIVQGGLGGARVLLDDTTVAKIHACTGPLFFAVAVALAVLTRRPASAVTPRVAGGLCAAVPVAAYAQLVAGAQLRHLDPATPPATFHALVGTHVLVGLVVAGLAIAAAVATRRGENRPARRWAWVATAFVVCQISLGLGTWVAKYGVPSAILPDSWRLADPVVARSGLGAVTVTAHAVLGMVILGVGVALAITAAGRQPAASRLASLTAAGGRLTQPRGMPA